MYIKEFLDSRDNCPICNTALEIKSHCYAAIMNLSLKENILNLKSTYFDYNIDITDNTVCKGSNKSHFEINLLLFCPFHTSISLELYEFQMKFDIYSGKIANESIREKLLLEDFQLISDSTDNRTIYRNSAAKQIILPYFDYSHMSLSKLREKLKTYILLS